MIELTRLNGHPIILNAELIKFVEQNPDTVITFVTGEKMIVREGAHEVMQKVIAYRRELLQNAPLPCLETRQIDPRVQPSAQE